MEKIRAMAAAELLSAERGHRPARARRPMDLVACWRSAIGRPPRGSCSDEPATDRARPAGVLHLMAKRNDAAAVQWLLDHGANPNARWPHWDADVTPLHLAALEGHAAIARMLLGPERTPGSATANTTATLSAGRNSSRRVKSWR